MGADRSLLTRLALSRSHGAVAVAGVDLRRLWLRDEEQLLQAETLSESVNLM